MDRDPCLTLFSLFISLYVTSAPPVSPFPESISSHCSIFHQQANAALFGFKASSSDRADCSSGKALNLYFGGSWWESRPNTSCPDRAFIFLSASSEFLDYEHFDFCHPIVLLTIIQLNSNFGLHSTSACIPNHSGTISINVTRLSIRTVY
jgi:hypothetical protein